MIFFVCVAIVIGLLIALWFQSRPSPFTITDLSTGETWSGSCAFGLTCPKCGSGGLFWNDDDQCYYCEECDPCWGNPIKTIDVDVACLGMWANAPERLEAEDRARQNPLP